MSSEWPFVPIGELTINLDAHRKPVKESDRKPGPYAYYGASGIVDHVDGYLFDGEHLLIAEDGENLRTRQTPIAFIANGKFWVNNHAHIIVGNEKASTRFLQYALLGTDISAYLTGAVMPKLTQGNLNRIQILCPPQKIQAQIVSTLGALDDRITLLRETNATLEAIAQAIFKSWFVDFDPVRAKMEGRAPEGMDEATVALFPDSFEESELGPVPRGWQVVTIGELCNVTIGGLWGKDTKENADLVPAICLRGVDLESLRAIGFAADAPVRWVKPTAMDRRRFSESEVLIASSGAGPCGRPLWAGTDFESIYGKPVIFSNFVKRLWCGSPAKAIFVDRLLSEMRHSREIWNYINGTSVPNLDEKLLLSTKKIVVPTNGVLESFEQIARAIYNKLYSQHAQTLTSLRDTLLPRLISGKLRLSEAENTIAEAIA